MNTSTGNTRFATMWQFGKGLASRPRPAVSCSRILRTPVQAASVGARDRVHCFVLIARGERCSPAETRRHRPGYKPGCPRHGFVPSITRSKYLLGRSPVDSTTLSTPRPRCRCGFSAFALGPRSCCTKSARGDPRTAIKSCWLIVVVLWATRPILAGPPLFFFPPGPPPTPGPPPPKKSFYRC